MTHPDQDIIDFLTKDLDLRAAPDWMIERARAFRDGAFEMAAQTCEAQSEIFGTDEYAVGQPWSSHAERFACGACAKAIRSLPTPPKDQNQ